MRSETKMNSQWTLFLATVALTVGYTTAACTVRHTTMLTIQPLLLDNNEYTDIRRFARGVGSNNYFTMAEGANITLACPGHLNYLTGGNTQPVQMVVATCVSSALIVNDNITIDITKVTCFKDPSVDVQIGNSSLCEADLVTIEVGVTIPGPEGAFLKLYEVCFDNTWKTPVSSYHTVVNGFRAGRTATMNAVHFAPVDPAAAYVRTAQITSFTAQLDSASATKYITTTNYLAAQLLVPKLDFVYGPLQLSGYFYFNSVPVWMSFTTSYWTSVETSIRTLANTDGDLSVYTSVAGIAQLADQNGVEKSTYLYAKGDNRSIPLPAFLIKSVLNSEDKQVIFVEMSHRRDGTRKLLEERVCAEDVCAQLQWLPWRNVPVAERPSITCCRADDALLRSRFPSFFKGSLRASASLLVGRAPPAAYHG